MMRHLTPLLLLLFSPPTHAQRPDSSPIGPRDRFHRHHTLTKTLLIDGIDHYATLQSCLHSNLTPTDLSLISSGSSFSTTRRVTHRIMDAEGEGPVILAVVANAMSPTHVRAVQALAGCVREHIPHMHEHRPMYQEFDMEEDPGLGGNNPTHLVPLVSLFLPTVVEEMYATLELAFDESGWVALVVRDEIMEEYRGHSFPYPKDAGMRASEHLTYKGFPMLNWHHDGEHTAYTMNFAFSGPDEYEGGEFIIKDELEDEHHLKPEKYAAMVFLGGQYQHAVSTIESGHREMYSTEVWNNPDIPFGSNLWTSTAPNMETYIELCNAEGQKPGEACNATFPKVTGRGVDIDDVKSKYKSQNGGGGGGGGNNKKSSDNNTPRTTPFGDESEFYSKDEEPNFFVRRSIRPGQIVPLSFRDIKHPIDGEAFTIGLPPQLLQEFRAYINANGMMTIAETLLYDAPRLKEGEHKVHNLADGMNWGAMNTGWESNTDMIWLDPADEECFESLLGVLRRGGFDVVLDAIGNHFELDGLMIQGVGAIFLSRFEDEEEEYDQLHVDIPGSYGSFYNVIVPIHIPKEDGAQLYVGDLEYWETIELRENVGVLLGGETRHGTAECDYRSKRDFRLSFAIYLADINEENVELIASDSTSLWPTEGDVDWFRAQGGRLWNKAEERRSLSTDEGRMRMNVSDKSPECKKEEKRRLCVDDPTGFRLDCPLTCRLYLDDDEYYRLVREATTRDCTDGHERCEEWEQRGECQRNPKYMLTTCRKSCRICGAAAESAPYATEAAAAAAPTCQDRHERCSEWAKRGECSKNPMYMRQHCQISCKHCRQRPQQARVEPDTRNDITQAKE